MLLKIKKGDRMAKQKCKKCGKTWQGWAQSDICPDCGGKLERSEKVEGGKQIKEILKNIGLK